MARKSGIQQQRSGKKQRSQRQQQRSGKKQRSQRQQQRSQKQQRSRNQSSKARRQKGPKQPSTNKRRTQKRPLNPFMKQLIKARSNNSPSFEYNGNSYKRKELKTGMVVYKSA